MAKSMIASRHYSNLELSEVFDKAVGFDKNCAKNYFEIASFYDSKNEKSEKNDSGEKDSDSVVTILTYLSKTLLLGRKFDHLAYPRFITLWLNNQST